MYQQNLSRKFSYFLNSLSTVQQYGTRQSTKGDIFLIQKTPSNMVFSQCNTMVAKCCNDIPDYIRRSLSVKSSELNLKSFLFEQDY